MVLLASNGCSGRVAGGCFVGREKFRGGPEETVTPHNVLGRIDATQYAVEVGLNRIIAQA